MVAVLLSVLAEEDPGLPTVPVVGEVRRMRVPMAALKYKNVGCLLVNMRNAVIDPQLAKRWPKQPSAICLQLSSGVWHHHHKRESLTRATAAADISSSHCSLAGRINYAMPVIRPRSLMRTR